MIQCEEYDQTVKGRARTPAMRCQKSATGLVACSDGSRKMACLEHERLADPTPTVWSGVRNMVARMPMPAFEAMQALAREVGL